jgi:hypothetical protein
LSGIEEARAALWPTAHARDGDKQQASLRTDGGQVNLSGAVNAALWPTVKASPAGPDFARFKRQKGKAGQTDDLVTAMARGTAISGFPASTPGTASSRGALNPAFAAWLMGYPPEFADRLLRHLATASTAK